MNTRQQVWAQRASEIVGKISPGEGEYKSICKSFPALIQASGLCQAIAFANKTEGKTQYIHHLAAVLGMSPDDFAQRSREADLAQYLKLSRDALSAAGWLKRYAEALLEGGV